MNSYIEYQVTEEDELLRIDRFMNHLQPHLSRTYIQKLIVEQALQINGKLCKSSYVVSDGDQITFTIPEADEYKVIAQDIPLDILYEDDDLLIINKPKGMVVHPAPGNESGTLVNAIMNHCKERLSGINGVMRPGIVHRIDKDTTGSLIVCKNDHSHQCIAKQLKEHSIQRTYEAIVHGELLEDGIINQPIGRHPHDRIKMAITHNGKHAVTHYKVLETFDRFTHIECSLETGRTHQIRVHMSSLNHPLLGDTLYENGWKSPFSLQGQTLHAKTLGFVHPTTKEYMTFSAPLPEYFQNLLDRMRGKLYY